MTNIWNKIKEFFKKVNSWIRKDGWLHIGVSAGLMVVFGLIFKLIGLWDAMFALPLFLTLMIGVGKEFYDSWKKKEPFEWHDIWCDLIGIGIGELLILLMYV